MRILLTLTLMAFALPAMAQEDWPRADTPALEVRAGDIVVTVPAPEWLDASDERPVVGTDGTARANWSLGLGLDIVGNSLDVTIQSLDDYTPYATTHMFSYSDDCSSLYDPIVEKVGDGFRNVALCGQEDGSGRGIIVYTLAYPMPDNDHAVDIWYRFAVDPFDADSEAGWPMSPEAFAAFVARLTDAISITAAGEEIMP